jgi:hypothetical protein
LESKVGFLFIPEKGTAPSKALSMTKETIEDNIVKKEK